MGRAGSLAGLLKVQGQGGARKGASPGLCWLRACAVCCAPRWDPGVAHAEAGAGGTRACVPGLAEAAGMPDAVHMQQLAVGVLQLSRSCVCVC